MEQAAAAQQATEAAYGELQAAHRAVAEDLQAVVRDNEVCAVLCSANLLCSSLDVESRLGCHGGRVRVGGRGLVGVSVRGRCICGHASFTLCFTRTIKVQSRKGQLNPNICTRPKTVLLPGPVLDGCVVLPPVQQFRQ